MTRRFVVADNAHPWATWVEGISLTALLLLAANPAWIEVPLDPEMRDLAAVELHAYRRQARGAARARLR